MEGRTMVAPVLRVDRTRSPDRPFHESGSIAFLAPCPVSKPLLYSGALSMFGAKVQIAALEKGVDFDLVMVPFDMQSGYAPKHPEVLRINPKRQVPVWVDKDLELYDSTQIFEYLEDRYPDPSLWPADTHHRAIARQLEHASDEVYFPHIIRLMGLQDAPQDPAYQTAVAAASVYYKKMDVCLEGSGGEYLAGAFTYADIAFFMAQFFGDRMGAPIGSDMQKLLQWRQVMMCRPSVKQVLSPMCDFLRACGRPVPGWARW